MSSPRSTKPPIIGLYGISGCGKTTLLNEAREQWVVRDHKLTFQDGSDMINRVCTGGLEEFKKLNAADQHRYREAAIVKVAENCRERNEVALIAGHYMFWNPKANPKGNVVATEADWKTYTHIIYFIEDPHEVLKRRDLDTRARPNVDVDELREWQETERCQLEETCWRHGILFTTLSGDSLSPKKSSVERLKVLMTDFTQHNETTNDSAIDRALQGAIPIQHGLEKVLLLDADKTLAPQDTGMMFWDSHKLENDPSENRIKALFQTCGYSYNSFRQATLLYEEASDIFEATCDAVAEKVQMYPEMIGLLERVAEEPHVGAVIVTCGLRRVWETVLTRSGLSHVKVIGGGRLADGYVVTGPIKGRIVDKLHDKGLTVLAIGDSELDIEMLKKADEAYVIVGEYGSRSSTMDSELDQAIDNGLFAQQILLPNSVTPRLNEKKLPIAEISIRKTKPNEPEVNELYVIFKCHQSFKEATKKTAAMLLKTPMRDNANQGLDLRRAHEDTGYYLATEYVSEILGLEKYKMKDTHENDTEGYRIRLERNTMIVPMMRGGEPMAFGVARALGTASLVHAKTFADIDPKYFGGKHTLILVDSVINSGASIVDFMRPLRKKYPVLQVVVVAGVVNSAALAKTVLAEMLESDRNLSIVTLRKSGVSYKGTKGTDTGHRLFNTTELD